MHKTAVRTIAILATGLLCACASAPEDIVASHVDPQSFGYMTCAQLSDYAARLDATYDVAANQQNEAYTYDVIGLIVLQEPVGSERYAGIPGELADLKGRRTAVRSLQLARNCDGQIPTGVSVK